MGSRWMGLGTIGLAALLALGCQNKVAEENRQLRDQTRELQAQLDEAHRSQQQRVVEARSTPAPLPPPTPVAPATSPNTNVTPAPKPDLGGLESNVDPVAGTTTVTLPGDVFFDPGKAEVKTSAKPTLDKVVAALKREYGGKTVRIEGYTDTDPIKHSKWKSNQELSEARASAVRDYLVSKGISANRLTIEGLGESKPKGTKAASRRVEVVVVTR